MDKSEKHLNKEIYNVKINNSFINKLDNSFSTFARMNQFGNDFLNKYTINNSLTNLIKYYPISNHWFTNYELPFSSINRAIEHLNKTFAINNNLTQLINYSQNFHNFLSNNNNFMLMSDAVKSLQTSFAIRDYLKEFSAQQEAISKMFSSTSIRDLAIYQQLIIDKLEHFDIEQENPKEFIENISQNDFEEQFEVIKQETNSKVKDYLKQNHLMILSIIIPIVFFIWQTCNSTIEKQNEKIISLLEQNQKTQIELLEVNKKSLSEDQIQNELITLQNELLKELIADIKTSLQNSSNNDKSN